MAKLNGVWAALEFESVADITFTDQKTGQQKTIHKYVGLMAHGDRTVTRAEINFPRDVNYRAVQLKPGETYLFPVLPVVGRKDGKLSYTIRTDLAPLPAPDLS